MLITCPSCAARYDVADTLVAAKGRHVQCTACHTRWFERPPAGSQAAVFGEDEILARLEARGGNRPRVITDHSAAAEVAPRSDPVAGRAFARDGSAIEAGSDDSARPAGPHLRLVEPQLIETVPETKGSPEAEGASPVPEKSPSTSGPDLHPVEGDTSSGTEPDPDRGDTAGAEPEPAFTPERPGPAPAPSGRPRIALEAPPPVDEAADERPAPPPRRGTRGIVAVLLAALAFLALLYFAADRLAAGMPALQPALTGYVGFIESAAETLANRLTPPQESGTAR